MSTHATRVFASDPDDWWEAVCECGWRSGAFPGADLAADAYGDHRADVARAELIAGLEPR